MIGEQYSNSKWHYMSSAYTRENKIQNTTAQNLLFRVYIVNIGGRSYPKKIKNKKNKNGKSIGFNFDPIIFLSLLDFELMYHLSLTNNP